MTNEEYLRARGWVFGQLEGAIETAGEKWWQDPATGNLWRAELIDGAVRTQVRRDRECAVFVAGWEEPPCTGVVVEF